MIPCPKLLVILGASVAGMSLCACAPSCTSNPAVTTAVVSTVIDVLFDFATASFPLKKFGRVASTLSISGGKAALKLETEIGKTGIKIGGAYPILNLKEAVEEAYRQKHRQEPTSPFEVNFSGSALIVTRGDERYLFFIESTSFCVANIDEASLVFLDHEKKIVAIEVSEEKSDIQFSTTTEGCNQIVAQIQERKRFNAIRELKNAMVLLGIRGDILSMNPETGDIEIEYENAAGRVRSTFNPNLLRAKYGIYTSRDVDVFRSSAQSKIDYCSEESLQASGNDTNSLHLARADCLMKEGYSENDQIYLKATGLLSA